MKSSYFDTLLKLLILGAKKPIKILNYFVEQILDKEKKNLLFEEYPKPITWDEIEKLSKNPIISFQSHSVTHTAVSSLNENEIEDEMIKSKEIIEQHTGLKVHSFCYPYGNEKSISTIVHWIQLSR